VTDEQIHHRQDESPKILDVKRVYDPVDEVEISLQEVQDKLVQAHGFVNRFAALSVLALEIDGSRTRDGIMAVLRKELKWVVECEFSFVALRNSSRSHYFILPISDMAAAADLEQKHFPVGKGTPGWVIDHRRACMCEVATATSFHDEIEGAMHYLGHKHILAVPLHSSDDTIGALVFSTANPNPFTDLDRQIAQMAALHVAIAMKNQSVFDKAGKHLAQIEMVNEIANKLTSTLELDDFFKIVAKTIRDAFNYFDVTVFEVNHQTEELLLVAHAGNFPDFLPHAYRQKMSDGIIGSVARDGKRIMANDVSSDPRYWTYEYHSTRSELAVPIRIESEVVGVLNVEDTKMGAFDETDAIVLETLCDQLGSALKNARLYDQIKKANEKLTELDRMKSDFLGIVSHDFRTPLASIMLAARAMLKRSASMEQKKIDEYLGIIIDQANRLSQLAEDTLSIIKFESGRSSYSFKLVNVERLIKDAQGLAHFSRRHIVEHKVDPAVAYINGDQPKLRQLVYNLISNAVKYSPKGGLVKITAEPAQGDQILISVSDEGIGIPEEHVGKLFQKFSRVDTEEAKEIPGSGLGLWICGEIVRAHGGRIWVESEAGKGSIFKVLLKGSQQES